MKDALIKLLKVKSIVTIAITIVFCVLALRGVVNDERFLTIFTVIISFYFGTQAEKSTKYGEQETNETEENE